MTTRRAPPIDVLWATTRPPASLDSKALVRALRHFLRGLGFSRSGLTVYFGSDADLKRLNARFRQKAKPTDVLSWSYFDGNKRKALPLLGELALSMDRIRTQARTNGWTMQTETLRLLAHGCVHLAGYDHETVAEDRVMRKLEEKLLARVGVKGLYPSAGESKGSHAHRSVAR